MEEADIILSNMSDSPSTTTISLFNLYLPAAVRDFFTGSVAATLTGSEFTVTLPAFGTAVYRLEKPAETCGE